MASATNPPVLQNYPYNSGRPRHVGIIPDGTRRWARQHQMGLEEAYNKASDKLAEFVWRLFDAGIHEVSVYAASRENLSRKGNDLKDMLLAIKYALNKINTELLPAFDMDCQFVGNKALFEQAVGPFRDYFPSQQTKLRPFRLNICLFYNPVDEILQALDRSPKKEELFFNLDVTTPLDLVVRTGGYQLLSNFLPMQSAYARLVFSDALFNDYTWDELEQVLNAYTEDQRKYGS